MSLSDIPEVLRTLPVGLHAGVNGFAELLPLQDQLGYHFSYPALLRLALTHPSWVAEHPRAGWPSQAVLEFFGDAVLDLCAAEAVWMRFPEAGEGVLTPLRIHLVAERALAQVAIAHDLGRWLFLARGTDIHGGRQHDAILADTLEAILGAAYLDARARDTSAMDAARRVFVALFGARVAELSPLANAEPKSSLQNLVQAKVRRTPRYEALSGAGEGVYAVRVVVDDGAGSVMELAIGQGVNRKLAEQAAATSALTRLTSGEIVL